MKFFAVFLIILSTFIAKISYAQDLQDGYGDDYRLKSFDQNGYDFNKNQMPNSYNDKNTELYNSAVGNYQLQTKNNYDYSNSSLENYNRNFYDQTTISSQNYPNIYNQDLTANKKNKKYKNFQDGMGLGYRVYDNSNRQSYFCGLNNQNKPNFTHDNNFNGLYFGIGANIANVSLEVDETFRKFGEAKSSKFSHSINGGSVNPSIIMGQGRLFSNGLFLGQEMSIIIGEISVNNNNLRNPPKTVNGNESELEKMIFKSSNFSFYSGKFGVNVFKNFIPYVKLGISFGEFNYISEFKGAKKLNNIGSLPTFVYGLGLDISVMEHFRVILDHSIFNNSIDGNTMIYDTDGSQREIDVNATINISRVNLVWKF